MLKDTIAKLWSVENSAAVCGKAAVVALAATLGAGCPDDPPPADAASPVDAFTPTDRGPEMTDSRSSTLYERLGEEAGIRAVVTDFVGRVVADPRINGYFLNANVDGARLIDCLVRQVGNATGGPQTYPDPPGTPRGCRDMASSHAGLGISQRDFDDLVGHLVAALMAAGVSEADIATIAGVLGPMASDIVEDPMNNETVYQRVGRKPGIAAVVDAFIARVVADSRINGFFGRVDAPRLRTCLIRQVCGIDGPCEYGQEVGATVGAVEPGVSADMRCRDMMSSHAGLRDTAGNPITIDDFNALVEDLVIELRAARVSEADISAIGGALGPTCPQIVADPMTCP